MLVLLVLSAVVSFVLQSLLLVHIVERLALHSTPERFVSCMLGLSFFCFCFLVRLEEKIHGPLRVLESLTSAMSTFPDACLPTRCPLHAMLFVMQMPFIIPTTIVRFR